MKLSKAQKKIMELMNSDWELGISLGIDADYWIQEGGLGKGGESKHGLNYKTISKLNQLDLIEINKKSFPTTSFKLTEKGKRYLERKLK